MWDVMDEELIGKCGTSQGMPKLFLWPISEPVWSTLQWSGRANMFYMFKKLFQTRERLTSWSCRIKRIVRLFILVHLSDLNKWKKFLESIKIWFVLGRFSATQNAAFFPIMHNHKCIHKTKESYVGKEFKGNRVIQANPELSDVSHPILRAKSKLHFLWDTLSVAEEPPDICGPRTRRWSFMILITTFPTAFNFK